VVGSRFAIGFLERKSHEDEQKKVITQLGQPHTSQIIKISKLHLDLEFDS